jgi:hypothetical protein
MDFKTDNRTIVGHKNSVLFHAHKIEIFKKKGRSFLEERLKFHD